MEVTWAPMLAAFSVPLDKSDNEVVTFQCLEGFRRAIHIMAVLCMRTQRDAFLTSLAKFTSLHSAADIKQKNIDAMKVLLNLTLQNQILPCNESYVCRKFQIEPLPRPTL